MAKAKQAKSKKQDSGGVEKRVKAVEKRVKALEEVAARLKAQFGVE